MFPITECRSEIMFNKRKFKESDCCRYCKYLEKNGEEYTCKYIKGEFKLSGICKKYVFNPFAPRVPRVRNLDTTMFDPLDFKI